MFRIILMASALLLCVELIASLEENENSMAENLELSEATGIRDNLATELERTIQLETIEIANDQAYLGLVTAGQYPEAEVYAEKRMAAALAGFDMNIQKEFNSRTVCIYEWQDENNLADELIRGNSCASCRASCEYRFVIATNSLVLAPGQNFGIAGMAKKTAFVKKIRKGVFNGVA